MLMKLYKLFLISILAVFMPVVSFAETDDTFDIVDSAEADIVTDYVSLNYGADIANVGGFDIADIMLGMDFDAVHSLVTNIGNLYQLREKNALVYTIHPDWKANLDYECRQQGLTVPTEIENCINGLARKRGLLYASELHLARPETGETIDVFFTSNASDNVVWRVIYKNDVNDQEGLADKFIRQRENKVLAFWQHVLEKYGEPNSGSDKWISSTNAYDPMMTAYYGALDLIDNGRRASDEAMNINQSRENFKAKPYAF